MNAAPSVDIIIPCFNMASYLPTAIKSALSQTYPHLGVVVVNDGSTDETAEVAQKFGNRIRYIEIQHSGLSVARNTGIVETAAEFLLFLDADDYLFPDAVDRHLQTALATPPNTIFHGGWQTIDDEGNILSMDVPQQLALDAFHSLLSGLISPCNCYLVRRSFLQGKMFDAALPSNEDWDLWLRLAAGGLNFAAVPEAIAVFRRRQSSMRSNHACMYKSYLTVIERAMHYHNDCYVCKKIYQECMKNWRYGHFYLLWCEYNSLRTGGQTWKAVATIIGSMFMTPQLSPLLLKAFYRRVRRLLLTSRI